MRRQIACPNCGKAVVILTTVDGTAVIPLYDAYRCGHCFVEINLADVREEVCA